MRPVLDVCCGSRMFWFDKQNPLAVFNDIRNESHTLCDGRALEVKPDTMSSYENLAFADSSFKLVVFDPPHLTRAGENGWQRKKYGVLSQEWRESLTKAFSECFRVLDDCGILIFKWNEDQVPVKEILALTKYKPLFGHISGKRSNTHWICFMKLGAPTA